MASNWFPPSFDNEARIWDASRTTERGGEGLFTLDGHVDRVNAVAMSRQGHLLASAGWDTDIHLWGLSEWQSPANTERPYGRHLGSRLQPGRETDGFGKLGPNRESLGHRIGA